MAVFLLVMIIQYRLKLVCITKNGCGCYQIIGVYCACALHLHPPPLVSLVMRGGGGLMAKEGSGTLPDHVTAPHLITSLDIFIHRLLLGNSSSHCLLLDGQLNGNR